MRRLVIAEALLGTQFWFPVWLILLVDRGFDLTTIVVADGLFRLTAVLTEVPTGILVDRIGLRRGHVLVASATTAVFAGVALVDTTVELVVVWVSWGVLWAMTSGTASAHLYELLHRTGAASERVAAFGLLTMARNASSLISLVLAGFLYDWAPSSPFLVTSALGLLAAGLLASLPPTRQRPTSVSETVEDVGVGPWQALSRSGLRRAVLLSSLVLLFGWSVRILVQPLLLDLDVPRSLTGLVYAGYASAGLIAGAAVRALSIGRLATVVLVSWLVLIGAGALTAVAPTLGPVLSIPLLGLGYNAATTATDVIVNDRASPRHRAATLSAAAALGGLLMVGARPALGIVADRSSVPVAFWAWTLAGVALLVPVLRLVRSLGSSSPDVRDLP